MSELISANALLAANLLLLGAAAIELLRVRRIIARHRRPAPEAAAGAPTRTAADDARLLGALDERIRELRQVAGELARPEQPPAPAERPDTAFDDAVRLARRGAPAAELSRSCGLNRGEAELMQRLYASQA